MIRLYSIIILFSISLSFALNPMHRIFKKDVINTVDSLFLLKEDAKYATVFKQTPKIYYGAAYKTINVPFDEVRYAFEDFNWITNLLSIITRFEKLENDSNIAKLGTYDFEVKVALARAWCVLDVDSININDSLGILDIVLKGNSDSTLNAKMLENHKGFWIVKNKDYYMKWRIEKREKNKTRIGFVTWMAPKAYIPYWLYKIVSKFTLPGVLDDLEEEFLKLSK